MEEEVLRGPGGGPGKRMPVLFIGHGSPMNAIESNDFTRALNALGESLPRPRAILCISAHWMTEGSWITAMAHPRTIHDFYGFPNALFEVQYPAPGSPELAKLVSSAVWDPQIHPDAENWGLDHGTWSVMKHLFPQADVPVLQLSVYIEQPGPYHWQLGTQLRPLRDQGILIIGSGNIVHNLRQIVWETNARPYDWAEDFDAWSKSKLETRDFKALAEGYLDTLAGRLSVPTPDHYYPLLPVLGASDSRDEMAFEFEAIHNASISMRAVSFGLRGGSA
jgi:4,5-DOPA dioxygenase extradiol